MAHSENIISSIKLPNGTTYQICDTEAIHNIEELGLSAALVFKGTKTTDAAITELTSAKVGDVYLSTGSNTEFVCITAVNGTANAAAWEKLGNIHDAASSNHTHTVTVTNNASAVTGKVTVPTVSKTTKYMGATATAPTITKTTDSVLGADTEFTVNGGEVITTELKADVSNVAVGANGTAKAITGFGAHTTAAAITALNSTTIKNPTATDVSIPNVASNTSVTASKVSSSGSVTAGKAASWGASVDANGVLSFSWTADTPTAVTLPTFTPVTATNTALGDPIAASKVTTSNVTVATASPKTTANAITVLGTATTANALTGVQVTTQPTVTLESVSTGGDVTVATGVADISISASGDTVAAMTGASASAPTVTLSGGTSSGTGKVEYVATTTIGSTTANLTNGSAAAQTNTVSVSAPK